jgi:DNA-directed RNA polymerase specialized sigma24 family protein
VPDLTDHEIRELLVRDPVAGWRAFVDQYTPTLLSLIERAGVSDHDEAMDLYIRACERLSAEDCARLSRHDPAKGPLGAWLSVVMRNVVVDWVRSRAGRRRLFHALEALPIMEQEVFDLFYSRDRTPAEICEILTTRSGNPVSLQRVFDALDAIERVLTARHRRELLALAARSRPASLEAELEQGGSNQPDGQGADSERAPGEREIARAFDGTLAALPPEDAAIVRLKYVQGLTHHDIQRALHLERLTDERVKGIVARLRGLLSGSHGRAVPGRGLAFQDGGAE